MKRYEESFIKVKYPKIKVASKTIQLSDVPFGENIFSCLFVFGGNVFLNANTKLDAPMWARAFFLAIFLCILFDLLSLNNTLIDFKLEKITRTNFNPVVLFWRRFLQIPKEIPFKNIELVYSDVIFGSKASRTKYIIYIRTDDPYDLPIGAFDKEDECKAFTRYLKDRMKKYK